MQSVHLQILKNAGLIDLLPKNEKGQVLCDHDLLHINLEKRVKLLQDSNFKDQTFEQILPTLIEKDNFHNRSLKDLQTLMKENPQKIAWFWQTIDKIDWKQDLDCDNAEKRLLNLKLSKREKRDLIDITSMFYAALDSFMDKKFSNCVPTPGADDSYSDFIWSAVGMGKPFYTKLFSELYTWPREEIQEVTVETFTEVFGEEFYE